MNLRELTPVLLEIEEQPAHMERILEETMPHHIHGLITDLPPRIQRNLRNANNKGADNDDLKEIVDDWLVSSEGGLNPTFTFHYKDVDMNFLIVREDNVWPPEKVLPFDKIDLGFRTPHLGNLNGSRRRRKSTAYEMFTQTIQGTNIKDIGHRISTTASYGDIEVPDEDVGMVQIVHAHIIR